MKITDPIGDMITRIRNGQMRGLKKVSVPGSKLRKAVLDVLQKEGFIQEYTVSKEKSFETIEINLKYMYGDPVIKEIERVSRPGSVSGS
jgi:small subunit ribosomal protein S8